MKGRARPPSSPESEESWTVDCPCGVSFDDGEEMVDCDECGVWVHTSCCRILKGHTSYVCDKCKFKKKKETEESEVAQLLVELPSKTPPLEDKVFSLRREQLSIEERAHVQGIPGGDPEFFVGVSPVFSRQLWKCTGYVPKVFQFTYNELPQVSDQKVSLLFGQYIEKQGDKDSTSSDLVKGECQQPEIGKIDAHYVLEAEKYYSPKEKSNEFEPRREYKHRHRFQQDENSKAHYQSKRRRDEGNRKDSISKKRTKNSTPTTDYNHQYGAARKATQEDLGLSIKPSRTTPKNLKTTRNVTIQNFVEDIDTDSKVVAINPSKVDIVSEHRPESPDRHVTGAESGTPAALNDEELALLLHQELNSSPRVGRVPRGRQGHPFSSKRPGVVSSPVTPNASQKDHQPIYRRKNRDELQGDAFHGIDDQMPKNEVSGDGGKLDGNNVLHVATKKDKDMIESCISQKLSSPVTITDGRHPSPAAGAVTEGLSHIDTCNTNELNEVDKRSSAENILTLPGLIEEILNEKGHNVSYDFICEEVLPHWSKLRKHNGERYAYSSHRQAVLDCLRNRSAWSHLIDRGPKTNLGRKRRRPESVVGAESDNADHLYGDDGDDHRYTRVSREAEVDGVENWPHSDSNKDVNLALPEEVPKGKRKARQGRRSALRSKGYNRTRTHHGPEDRLGEHVTGMEDEHVFSPFSDDIASSSSEEDRILTHRSVVTRCHGDNIDNDDEDELDD